MMFINELSTLIRLGLLIFLFAQTWNIELVSLVDCVLLDASQKHTRDRKAKVKKKEREREEKL